MEPEEKNSHWYFVIGLFQRLPNPHTSIPPPSQVPQLKELSSATNAE